MIGTLSRTNTENSIQINTDHGRLLQILVESQGRMSFGILNEPKGIVGDVTINNQKLENWNATGYSFEHESVVNDLMSILPYVTQESDVSDRLNNRNSDSLSNDPIIFKGEFDINDDEVNDTYIDTTGWGKVEHFSVIYFRFSFIYLKYKLHFIILFLPFSSNSNFKQGFIIVNEFNLGRYWPTVGPQVTLYLPKEILLKKDNSIIVVELEKAPKNGEIKFSKTITYLQNKNVVHSF